MTGSIPLKGNKCPAGYTRRKGYTRKNTGTHVKTACVRKTTTYSKKPMNTRKRQATRLARVMGTKRSCPPGQISRKAYVRRITSKIQRKGYTRRTQSGKLIRVYPKSTSVFVAAGCVEDTGKPGKLPEGAPIIGPLRKGELAKHGYSYKLPEGDRHQALMRAVQEFGALGTYRKLNAVAKLTARTVPNTAMVFARDRNWIRNAYGVKGSLKAF